MDDSTTVIRIYQPVVFTRAARPKATQACQAPNDRTGWLLKETTELLAINPLRDGSTARLHKEDHSNTRMSVLLRQQLSVSAGRTTRPARRRSTQSRSGAEAEPALVL